MNTYIRISLKAVALVILSLAVATTMNFILSLVFMTSFKEIQQSAIWILHAFIALGLVVVAAETDNK
jgi:hypothetical protein